MEGGDPKVGHCEDLFDPLHNNVNILKQCSLFFSTAVQFYTVKTFYCSLLVKEDKLYRILFTLIKSQILFFFFFAEGRL